MIKLVRKHLFSYPGISALPLGQPMVYAYACTCVTTCTCTCRNQTTYGQSSPSHTSTDYSSNK